MHKTLILLSLLFLSSSVFAQGPKKAEIVSINGKNLYYEVHGSGEPLIMLHGYSLSSRHWLPYVEDFEKEYEVYLIDLTGHGKSAAFKEDLSLPSVGEDLKALLDYLQLEKVKAIGFSFGGDVLFQLALKQPDVLESMITIGAVGSWDVNDFPEYLEAFAFGNVDNFPWLRASHSSDDQIRGILEQFKNYIVHVSDEQLKSIPLEVLIMLGDDDPGIPLTEVARVRKHLPNSDLWILPAVSHGAHQGETKEEFIKKAKAFFASLR